MAGEAGPAGPAVPAEWEKRFGKLAELAVGETVILLLPPSTFIRCFNGD